MTERIVSCPRILESLDILLLQTEYIVLVLTGLNIMEALVNDRNEDIHENEESGHHERKPEDKGEGSFRLLALMHDAVPGFTGASAPQRCDRKVERTEVSILVDVLTERCLSK